jgi:citrate lyase subunit beta/citryl-CoA lyase
LIHPKQLAAANMAFAPAPEALARARRIIEAWQQASAAGKAVVVVDGRLVENLHVQEAERDLELAERIGRVGW